MSHWNEKDTRLVDLPFERSECLGVWICLNCGLVTNNQPACGYQGRCNCGSSSWDIVLDSEDEMTPSEIIEDRKNTVVVCSPPPPRHLEQYMDDDGNRFVYIDSQWTRIGGPKEEEPIPHVCTNCGLVITDAADPEDYVCPSCFCEGTLIKIEGLERWRIHGQRKERKLSKEMNYHDFVVTSSCVDVMAYEDSEFFRVWNNLQFMPCIRCQRWALDNISGDEGIIDGGPHTYEGWDLCVPCEHNLRVVSELRRGGPSKEFQNRANYHP